MEILQFFIIGVTVIVVAVPEGLPLAVTICLAYSVRAMMKDKNLVRHLDACEVMGGCTNICSDKTGTLTENRMSVVAGWIATTEWKEGETWDRSKVSKDVFGMLTEGICVNSKANINRIEGEQLPQFVGNPTECAMLAFLEKNEVNYRTVREGNHVVHVYSFKSARKRMSSVIEAGETGYRLHCKGASEMILRLCTHYMLPDGSIVPLTPEMLAAINNKIEEMANQALRTLAVAYRDFTEPLEWAKLADNPPEEKLICTAVLGILDPLRQGVPEAVRTCQNAGVMVRMVTGDNLTTAKKIAEQCGIYNPKNGGVALEGPEFARIYKNNPADIDQLLPNLQVLARSSPTDKYNLVKRLRKNGQIVAVTGDGTNDAPALKKAHVGLAMGIAGTEVAKFAADIIIMDDNFTSIVKTVMWGRSVFDNVRKFLQFQLTVNLAALIIVLIGAATKQGTPLKAVQLLWVNLIMDTFAALALATEKPTEQLLHRLPINIRQARFISNKMLKHIAGQAIWQVAILLAILYVPAIFKVDRLSDAHYGAIFNVFVWMQLFNELNARKINDELNVLEGFFTNWIFLGVIFITIVGQVIIVEFGGAAFHTAHQNWWQWLLSIAFGTTSLAVGFALRLVPTDDKVERTPYNVELSPEKLAKRLKKSVSKPDPNKKAPAAAAEPEAPAHEGDKKKNDLEV